MTRFGIIMDEEYNATHKRKRLTLWSGRFSDVFEGQAYSLPKGDGYMVTLPYGDKLRVTAPVDRTDTNYMEQDKAFNDALNAYYTPKSHVEVSNAIDELVAESKSIRHGKSYKPNGKPILSRR